MNLALLGLIVAMGLLLVLDYVINMIAIKQLIYNIFGIYPEQLKDGRLYVSVPF